MEAEPSSHIPLIQGLPDEIALSCLARVPRCYHVTLRCVSRRWRALLSSADFHLCRLSNNWHETWIYAVCKDKSDGGRIKLYILNPDPLTRSWKVLHVLGIPCPNREGMCIETVGKKLYLLGGCGWREDATDEVYFLDAGNNHWNRAASMPSARCYFVVASLKEKLIVTSGLGLTDRSPNLWDIYDPVTDSWHSHKSPMLTNDIVKFISLEDKLYTIHKTTWNSMHFAGIYDPYQKVWYGTENEIATCSVSPTVVIDGTLYMLDESNGRRLLMWRGETGGWVPLGRLSDQLVRPPCQLVAVGRSIYVIGRGFGTVVIDVDLAARGGGRFLICSSINHVSDLPELAILSCNAITI